MPILKPIKGHTSCKWVKRYLEKDNRALATDLINLEVTDSCLRNWAEQMDYSRAFFGTDESQKNKKTRTYNHYVLSPDPTDNLTLDQLREFTKDFLHQAFGERFEIAVVYHDDNKNHIPHAHIIVNNVNFIDGGRLSSWLTNARVKEISNICQNLAKDYGYHNFLDQKDAFEKQLEADRLGILDVKDIPQNEFHGISGSKRRVRFATNQENFYSKHELEILNSGGYSWKEDIRSRVRIARELSTTEKGFLSALKNLDVECKTNKNGDYRYSLIDSPSQSVNGYRLGRAYTRHAIRFRLKDEDTRKIRKPDSMQSARIMAAFDSFRIVGLRTIGYINHDSGLTLRNVADALEIITKHNLHGKDAFNQISTDTDAATLHEINQAKAVMNQLGRHSPFNPEKEKHYTTPEISVESLSAEEAARLVKARHKEFMKDAPIKPNRQRSKKKLNERSSVKRQQQTKQVQKNRNQDRGSK